MGIGNSRRASNGMGEEITKRDQEFLPPRSSLDNFR